MEIVLAIQITDESICDNDGSLCRDPRQDVNAPQVVDERPVEGVGLSLRRSCVSRCNFKFNLDTIKNTYNETGNIH